MPNSDDEAFIDDSANHSQENYEEEELVTKCSNVIDMGPDGEEIVCGAIIPNTAQLCGSCLTSHRWYDF